MRQDLKLLPICWAVAAGVTSKAVTKRAPTILTILTTTIAVITLKKRPICLDGIPWICAETGSIEVASNPLCSLNIESVEIMLIVTMRSRLALSIRRRLPNRYPSTSFCTPPPYRLNTTKPNASIPVRKIAIEASPVRIPVLCISNIKIAAITENASAIPNGSGYPRTKPTHIPPKDT